MCKHISLRKVFIIHEIELKQFSVFDTNTNGKLRKANAHVQRAMFMVSRSVEFINSLAFDNCLALLKFNENRMAINLFKRELINIRA